MFLVPPTVVAGFSAGIGAIMFISQLNVLFGVHAPAASILMQLLNSDGELSGMRMAPLILGCIVMLTAATAMRWSPRMPAPLLAWRWGNRRLCVRMHEPRWARLQLSLPPFAGFS